ncbi:hypothetical protein [Phytohabitans rumicis]|uniref:Uncharacterized protein n=1 Tax=Phytohabitans rumicis TaxID=1076125 RepID=A0A6V8L3Y3_9ACTN|nr:hypothetical protein [Phytohabitans rumicis]GFJ88777.1 hypothetical protein Prum_024190 [Phytohabitans rumicis]
MLGIRRIPGEEIGLVAAHPAPAAAVAGGAWDLMLYTVDGDDANVVWSTAGLTLAGGRAGPASAGTGQVGGYLVGRVHATAQPVNLVRANVVAATPAGMAVSVEVRALLGAQRWSEWTEAPATLPDTTAVQVRVGLFGAAGATPSVRGVRLTAGRAESAVAPLALGNTYRVYATREGLVGGTTANGHVITSRDHFVALPSRRGLAPRDTGDYTVRVCAASGRCEWAPVWDVGPWNTTDDYWNPPSVRPSWTDLPQGRPEAQAAYEVGYNGGKDQFGRTVANPAGIDLADGTFWDGLLLTTTRGSP